jgi:two-component system phosphate regulon response regulator PhoB
MKNQPHILYAEDDPDTRELVQLFLQHAGFRVSLIGDSSEVLSLVATDHVDVLLLDNWMPGITGLELCRRIRSFDQSIPILFCSGAVTEADKKAALSAGAQGYIGKPFDPEDLITTLRAALNIQTT